MRKDLSNVPKQMDNTEQITKKELFERLIKIKAKPDTLDKANQSITKYFTIWVIVIICLEIINVTVHILL